MTFEEMRDGERRAFKCPECGGQVVLCHTLPTRVTSLGSIDFRCLDCGDWIDVYLDKNYVFKPVYEFENYATAVATEFFESLAKNIADKENDNKCVDW